MSHNYLAIKSYIVKYKLQYNHNREYNNIKE